MTLKLFLKITVTNIFFNNTPFLDGSYFLYQEPEHHSPIYSNEIYYLLFYVRQLYEKIMHRKVFLICLICATFFLKTDLFTWSYFNFCKFNIYYKVYHIFYFLRYTSLVYLYISTLVKILFAINVYVILFITKIVVVALYISFSANSVRSVFHFAIPVVPKVNFLLNTGIEIPRPTEMAKNNIS